MKGEGLIQTSVIIIIFIIFIIFFTKLYKYCSQGSHPSRIATSSILYIYIYIYIYIYNNNNTNNSNHKIDTEKSKKKGEVAIISKVKPQFSTVHTIHLKYISKLNE